MTGPCRLFPATRGGPSTVLDTYETEMRWTLFTTSNSNAEAGPSKLPAIREAAAAVPTVNRYEGVLKDEERYQELQYPTTEEVPGCMTLL